MIVDIYLHIILSIYIHVLKGLSSITNCRRIDSKLELCYDGYNLTRLEGNRSFYSLSFVKLIIYDTHKYTEKQLLFILSRCILSTSNNCFSASNFCMSVSFEVYGVDEEEQSPDLEFDHSDESQSPISKVSTLQTNYNQSPKWFI